MKYKNQHQKKPVLQIFIILFLLIVTILGGTQITKVRDLFSQANFNQADFYIDTQAVIGNMPRPWRNLAQGGEDYAWRLAPLSSQVSQLKPSYIRLDHIYDFYDVVSGSSGNITLNFSKLDLVLDDIRAVGAIPFISLSYMPPAISKSDIVDQPINCNDWQYLVQKTVEHISGKKGFNNVYYEVWNEPDLFGSWKYYGEKNYLNLYAASVQGASKASGVKNFKIGGPATTSFYSNWFKALLEFADKNQLRLDFISWHRYTNDFDQYKRDMADIHNLIADFPQYNGLTEFLITEWGHDSENNTGYDTSYSAAHTVGGAISMVGLLDKAFIFEIQDGKNPNNQTHWGRWGMFTAKEHGGKPKQRYFGLKMLDQIADQRLQVLGQGSKVKALAAKKEDGTIQLVISNFDQSGQQLIPLTYQNLPQGEYLFQAQYLSGRSFKKEVSHQGEFLQLELPVSSNEVVFSELSVKP